MTHNSVILAVAPDGQPHIVRSEALVSVGPPFAWSPSIQARVVQLSTGSIIVLDTPANMAAIGNAFNPSGGSVQPAEQAQNSTTGGPIVAQ